MAEVTYKGKLPRAFAGVVWKKDQVREVTKALHLDYYNRHPDYKVKGTVPDKPSVVAEKQRAAKKAPSGRAKAKVSVKA